MVELSQSRRRAPLLGFAAQTGIVALLLSVYRLGRQMAEGHVSEAFRNANTLWRWERDWKLPDELSLVHWFVRHPLIARTADTYYASVHFPLTALALAYLFWRRRELYRWTRDVLVVMTAAGLVLTFTVPMTPPRLMTSLGFPDVAADFGQSIYDSAAATGANQYAAMPSLHVGWALLIGIALARAGTTRFRWLWLGHPTVTLLVVVGTANHYWSDGIVGVLLLLLAVPVVARGQRWARSRGPQRRARVTPGSGHAVSTAELPG
jgi:hypothetical protein